MKKNQQRSPLAAMHLEEEPLIYLHEHFKKNKKSDLKNNWVWYSLDELKSIVAAIEQIEIDEPQKTGDGVRLYYGIYNKRVCDYLTALPKTGPDKNRNYSDHEGHNTVFFIPTFSHTGSKEIESIDCIPIDNVVQFRDNYNHDRPMPVPHPWTGGFDVGNICPPPPAGQTGCSKSGSNL